jgi:hypothetical protein
MQEIEKILAKPGKDWTPEERKVMAAAVKKYGREKLKQMRKEMN